MTESLKYILENALKDEMVEYIKSHPEDFETLIEFALANHQPYSWRSAWLLSSCMKKNDSRIVPFIPQILDILETIPDGQARDLLGLLRKMKITEEYEGRVLDICINIWCKIDKIPSVRYNAFRLALPIFKKYPDLKQELELLTQKEYLDSLSPGIQRSIQKMIETYNR